MAKEKRNDPKVPKTSGETNPNFQIETQGIPGFPVQNESRQNFFDGKAYKFPQVKSFWEAQEDDEVNG